MPLLATCDFSSEAQLLAHAAVAVHAIIDIVLQQPRHVLRIFREWLIPLRVARVATPHRRNPRRGGHMRVEPEVMEHSMQPSDADQACPEAYTMGPGPDLESTSTCF